MTLHFHGTPITPAEVLLTLAGRCFCVSYFRPEQVRQAHQIGQSVMLDNGAFSAFTQGKPVKDWSGYYAWCDQWLDHPTTWAVIPDEIDAGSQQQDALLREWPHGERGAPVWHMDEPIDRLARLTETWPRVCIGSTGEFWQILSPAWTRRMDEAWDSLAARHTRTPTVHMLRGMQLATREWPFASVDSTDIGRNHNRGWRKDDPAQVADELPRDKTLSARAMADRWDAAQCPAQWVGRQQTREMFG